MTCKYTEKSTHQMIRLTWVVCMVYEVFSQSSSLIKATAPGKRPEGANALLLLAHSSLLSCFPRQRAVHLLQLFLSDSYEQSQDFNNKDDLFWLKQGQGARVPLFGFPDTQTGRPSHACREFRAPGTPSETALQIRRSGRCGNVKHLCRVTERESSQDLPSHTRGLETVCPHCTGL